MKTLRTLLVIAIAIFGFTATSFGQDGSNKVTGTATATVFKTLKITQTTPLNFGKFGALTSGASTVVVSNAGARSGSADAVTSTDITQGIFAIEGQASTAFNIVLPATDTDLKLGGTGPEKMTITATTGWDSSLGTSSTLGADGTKTLNLGATLNVGANQKEGTYTGSFEITVAYN